jgi:transcriptional regulator with XRE-family HTH domain
MSIIDNILLDRKPNSKEICQAIAKKVKARRLDLNMTQEGICKRTGVNISSYRRFERTGLISLEGLVKISFVLEMEKDFDKLFTQRIYQSIDDVIESNFTKRKRGKKNG